LIALLCTGHRSKRKTEIENLNSSSSSISSSISSNNIINNNSIKRVKRDGWMSGKRAQFWNGEQREWEGGNVHAYVTAEERNADEKRFCKNAIYDGIIRTRGMYRYTLDKNKKEQKNLDVDYFSDEDITVKVT
jgi:hypothetical protein